MATETEIEDEISRLLWRGVWASCALAALGMAIYVLGPQAGIRPSVGDLAVLAGVVVLLMTPAARVAMLLAHYVRARDHDFVLITLFVLFMMTLGYISGAA